jgi:hypothetical protein
MPKSAYLRSALLKHAVGKTAFTMPSNKYLALFTSDPTINAVGTEVAGGSYARQSITWGTEANGGIANSNVINFTNLPACTITHWAIYDASSGGNMLYFGPFEINIVRTAGQAIDLAAGAVEVNEA